jgi:hypothetical protein
MKYLIFIFLFLTASVFSQENQLEEKIKKEIKYNEDDYFSFEIKTLPNNPSNAIVVLVKYNGAHESDGFDCDLILQLVETSTGKTIHKITLKNEYSSDAISLTNIALDMGNYKIKEGKRAFGIRSHYVGSSSVYPYVAENISLFMIQDNTIVKILDNFEAALNKGETDLRCHSTYEESNAVFIIQKEKTNEFYNISVKTKVTITKSMPSKTDEDDCIETKTELKPTYKTLIYKNGKYSIKK